jgi:hypothetical protein
MKYIFLFIIAFTFNGCSPKNLDNTVENMMISLSGNEPPQSFRVANLQTMKDYVFNTKDFSFSLPLAKESDFTKMGGWEGMSMRDGKTIVLGLKDSIVYHIHVTSSIYKYEERERAVENEDLVYLNNRYHKYYPNKNISLQRHGKENYICEVKEGVTDRDIYQNKEKISFGCYSFNTTRTKAKIVGINLTYNRSNNPNIAKEYTYEDLQERAKRMLDSLYIKDGWDE